MHKRLEQQTGEVRHWASFLRGFRLRPKVLSNREPAGVRSVPALNGGRFRSGLTLTEVVVASGLLMIAMVPVLKGLTLAHMHTSIIERKTKSLLLAQARLEEIRARSIYHYSDFFARDNEPLGDSYLCNVTDTSASPNLREITVAVGQDLDGNNDLSEDEIEVTLATRIARRWDS